jgi:hypothetical protein
METIVEGNFEKIIVLETNYSPVQSVNGRVGFVTIDASGIGLGNVDNTSDLDKPISIATENRINSFENTVNNSFLDIYQYINSTSGTINTVIENISIQQDLKIRTPLESGIENKYINYPFLLPQRPKTVHCEIENDIDDLIYMHKISNISNTGFLVSFSDKLSSSGYFLNIQVGK